MMNTYEQLSNLDVSKLTEKKGKFTYLSWASALDVLLKFYPESTWEVIKSPAGWPYVETPSGCFVEVALTINGITRSQVHPVLDNNNKAIKEPNAFQINTSIQRALAKAISLHGLGLYIYRGEDLPADPQKISPDPINQEKVNGAYKAFKEVIDADVDIMDFERVQYGYNRLSNDEQIAVFSTFSSDKPEGSTKGYKAIIKELLAMKKEEFFDANLLSGDK